MKSLQRDNINLKNRYIVAAGGIWGAVLFLCIYGFAVIDPTYDDWIWKSSGDITQHYIGWLFYRRSDWHFPIGLIDGLVADTKVSCMFTDSIPLFAVFFKLLSPILPDTFQYMGIWGLFCFIAQGAMAALLLHKFSKSTLFCLIGSTFFIASPVVIHRMFSHSSLAGHWIILFSIILWAYQDHRWKHKYTPVILWTLNGVLAVLTHIYFIPMIYMIMIGYVLTDVLKNRKLLRPLLCIASTTAFSLLIMFCVGAFYGDGEMSAGGLGAYSANLNSLFNGMSISKFLKPLNTASNGQQEGLGYLGLGMIIAGCLALVVAAYCIEKRGPSINANIKSLFRKYRWGLLAVFIVIFLSVFFAASPIVTLNARVLYKIDYTEKIWRLLAIFRASGRFIWVTDYLLFTAILAVLSKLDGRKTLIFSISMCMVVQLLDLRDFIMLKHDNFAHKVEYVSSLSDSVWEKTAESSRKIVFLPSENNFRPKAAMYYTFAKYAYENDMELSSFCLARDSYKAVSEYAAYQLELLEAGKGDPDALYVFTGDYEDPGTEGVTVFKKNGYTAAKCEPSE